MLGGIYAGDVQKLSIRATLPKYQEYEEKFGSVVTGLQKERRREQQIEQQIKQQIEQQIERQTEFKKQQHRALGQEFQPESQNESGLQLSNPGISEQAGARYSTFLSLDNGMQLLVERLVKNLAQTRIHTNQKVESIVKSSTEQFQIKLQNGRQSIFDRVILAVPAASASNLLRVFDQQLSEAFSKIQYSSSVVLCFLFSKDSIKQPLNAFGMVVPTGEKKSIIAASFSSIKFSNRCPESDLLIRVFLGGSLNPSVLELTDKELCNLGLRDLASYLKIDGEPKRTWIKRWPNSMPQYLVGHLERVAFIESRLAQLRGLTYAGAGLGGVGIPDCVASGEKAALRTLAH
jgi:oxygen-dependent protoporphyrinogen oxidase